MNSKQNKQTKQSIAAHTAANGPKLTQFVSRLTNAEIRQPRKYFAGQRVLAINGDGADIAYFVSPIRYMNSYEDGTSNAGSGAYVVLCEDNSLKVVSNVKAF